MKKSNGARITRMVIEVVMLLGITLMLCDITGLTHRWLSWMAGIQLMPALLSLSVVIVVVWIVLTLLLGRVYCSTICPLGGMQDVFAHLGHNYRKRHQKAKGPHTGYRINRRWLRLGIAVAFFVLLAVPMTGVLAHLLEPYSAYGRIASSLIAPLYEWVNNGLAALARHYQSYLIYETPVMVNSWIVLSVAAATLLILSIWAALRGREYCNTICPVGTMLSWLSRWTIIRPVINTDKCTNCGGCGRKCKANAIDTLNHRVDMAQCIDCYDCMDYCKQGAISLQLTRWGRESRPVDKDRRKFLGILGGLAVAGTVEAQMHKMDGGLAAIEKKKVPERAVPVRPAGSLSLRHFSAHCTACQLCVSACPSGVLQPSRRWENLMQPELQYQDGYCILGCNRCAEVCPTNAIMPIAREEKSAIQIGHAVWIADNCVVKTDGVSCGNCAEHCPTGAIQMVDGARQGYGHLIPSIDTERCIGCGKCEYVCPSRPFSAIYVEGVEEQRPLR